MTNIPDLSIWMAKIRIRSGLDKNGWILLDIRIQLYIITISDLI
jgi:hypothetical protein